jgi:hypothetical protein
MQILAASERNATAAVDDVLARARATFEDDSHGHLFIHLLLVTFLRLVATFSHSPVVDWSEHFGPSRSDSLDSNSCLCRNLFSSSGCLLQRKHLFVFLLFLSRFKSAPK